MFNMQMQEQKDGEKALGSWPVTVMKPESRSDKV